MGWLREQAAGLAANLNIESGLRPDITGDNGAAYGIGQWHPDRQGEFKRVFGHEIRGSTLEEQLQFENHELTRGREQGRDARFGKRDQRVRRVRSCRRNTSALCTSRRRRPSVRRQRASRMPR
ncbi:phage tail protein [Caballeronia novacaledonica]|uniref:Phage tail protein n=1 Tax=Caballeronia novacaledonica TaxID=1544861 RepID=A0A2U3I487_9BURK|nr:phage tail tip lysozyme [Caballeronia novacaledonica]SPB14882.1 phage tail protein [Caballeronia novacaledonica]